MKLKDALYLLVGIAAVMFLAFSCEIKRIDTRCPTCGQPVHKPL